MFFQCQGQTRTLPLLVHTAVIRAGNEGRLHMKVTKNLRCPAAQGITSGLDSGQACPPPGYC